MLRVAIASENEAYDGAVFERLLSLLLETDVERWKTTLRIQGHRAVIGLAEPFLRQAASAGLKHALFAVDNDGGARRGPEHEESHQPVNTVDPDGCRTCGILNAIPEWWMRSEGRTAVAVPVQTLETWLLCLRGHAFIGPPERTYDRWVLKKAFFGKPLPAEAERTRLAMEQLARSDCLAILRQRPSFRTFEEQLKSWR